MFFGFRTFIWDCWQFNQIDSLQNQRVKQQWSKFTKTTNRSIIRNTAGVSDHLRWLDDCEQKLAKQEPAFGPELLPHWDCTSLASFTWDDSWLFGLLTSGITGIRLLHHQAARQPSKPVGGPTNQPVNQLRMEQYLTLFWLMYYNLYICYWCLWLFVVGFSPPLTHTPTQVWFLWRITSLPPLCLPWIFAKEDDCCTLCVAHGLIIVQVKSQCTPQPSYVLRGNSWILAANMHTCKSL